MTAALAYLPSPQPNGLVRLNAPAQAANDNVPGGGNMPLGYNMPLGCNAYLTLVDDNTPCICPNHSRSPVFDSQYQIRPHGIRTENGISTPTLLHMDHLGSAQTGTDLLGMVSWREEYTPYGITLTNPLSNKDQAGFTGHIKDSATGLNYMQARYYDPDIGRFLSIDPINFTPNTPKCSTGICMSTMIR